MSTLFVLKNIPVFLFQECRKIWTKLHQIQPPPPPPPPSLSISKQLRISILESQSTVRVSFTLLVGGRGGKGGGGVDFQERVWSLVSPLVEKELQGHFFTEKESACQISVDSEQLGKSLRNSHIGPACKEPLNYRWLLVSCPSYTFLIIRQSIIWKPISMFYRHLFIWLINEMFPDSNERLENIKLGVEKAKEALSCDVKDGTSWCMESMFSLQYLYYPSSNPPVVWSQHKVGGRGGRRRVGEGAEETGRERGGKGKGGRERGEEGRGGG